MVRLLCLDSEKTEVYEIEVDNDILDDYYKYLNCECFDIARRKIGGKYFDIFCDDVGLFKEGNAVSAVTYSDAFEKDYQPNLVGNLIFANHDSEGNTVSLSDDDVELIRSKIISYITTDKKGIAFRIAVVCEY